jgi:hypothetical protein
MKAKAISDFYLKGKLVKAGSSIEVSKDENEEMIEKGLVKGTPKTKEMTTPVNRMMKTKNKK